MISRSLALGAFLADAVTAALVMGLATALKLGAVSGPVSSMAGPPRREPGRPRPEHPVTTPTPAPDQTDPVGDRRPAVQPDEHEDDAGEPDAGVANAAAWMPFPTVDRASVDPTSLAV